MNSYGKKRVVCTLCGAKGNEPCIGQITGNKMPIKHAPWFQKPLGQSQGQFSLKKGSKP